MTNGTMIDATPATPDAATATTTDTSPAAVVTGGMDATVTTTADDKTDKPAEGATDAKAGETATDGDTKGDDAKPVVPEKYDLKFEDGATLDTELLTEFEAFAKEQGLDQERAQALANFGPKMAAKFAAKQIEAINTEVAKWGTDTANDKELGGDKLKENLATAKKALDAFGTPELQKMLGKFDLEKNTKGTGLGNHPEVLRLLFKVGKAISEDGMVTAGGTHGTAKDAASVLYPNMKK